MADASEDSPGVPDDCEGPRLDTLKRARQALEAACRLIKAGKLPTERAGTYVNALTALVKAHQDARDSKWTTRAAVMWQERESQRKQTNARPAPPH
jgi:polyhydroxyalkanoate synthesis regulator phasin